MSFERSACKVWQIHLLGDPADVAGIIDSSVMGPLDSQTEMVEGFVHAASTNILPGCEFLFEVDVGAFQPVREWEAGAATINLELVDVVETPRAEHNIFCFGPVEKSRKDLVKGIGTVDIGLADRG